MIRSALVSIRALLSVRRLWALAAAACVALGAVPQARAIVEIVVPNDLAAVEGNLQNSFPFDLASVGASSQRYQQVYAASQFGTGPIGIAGLWFRPDAGAGSAFSATIGSIEIRLSTTSAGPMSLSATFADNVGMDETVVYSGALPLSSNDEGPVAGPKFFDIEIPLQHTFVYDPAAGNLLVDVRNSTGEATTPFNGEAGSSVIGRVFTSTGGSVSDATGTLGGGSGLVTFFLLPEPNGGAEALAAGAALACLRRRRARREL